MADIKTRETRRDIKLLDKAAVAGERMKEFSIRTKDQGTALPEDRQTTPGAYAAEQVQDTAQALSRDSARLAGRAAKKAAGKGKALLHGQVWGETGPTGGKGETSAPYYTRVPVRTGPPAPERRGIRADPTERGRALAARRARMRYTESRDRLRARKGEPAVSAAGRRPGLRLPGDAKHHGASPGPAAFAGRAGPHGSRSIKTARHTGKTAIKTAGNAAGSARQGSRAARTAAHAARAAAQRAAVGAKALSKGAASAAKGIAAGAKTLAAALAAGGSTAALAAVLLCLLGLVLASPFGILFTGEPVGEGTVSLGTAIAQIQQEYAARLAELQSGTHHKVLLQGTPPDWREVVAVFAVRTAGAEDGVDVVTLDADRVERLRTVFWDMTELSASGESIDHPDSDPDDDTDDSWSEIILTITITSRTADEMRLIYAFTPEQNRMLDELLEYLDEGFGGLFGSLAISDAAAQALLDRLPEDLDPERRAVVEAACSLVGKVHYFWGGKSLVLGWDARWGITMQVTAPGSSSTGTYRPFGLDCSGYVDWVFYNASGGSCHLSRGGGTYSQHAYSAPVPWSTALPGDLVFYPGDSHVGIVGGRDENGNLLIIHCASGANNVVITGAGGFTSLARPTYFLY